MEEELTAEFGIDHLVENGVPREYAERNIWLTDYGKDTILKLYRSAVDIGAEWQPDLEKLEVPAMVIWGRTDPYVPLEFGEAPGGADESRAGGARVRPLVALRAPGGDRRGAAPPLGHGRRLTRRLRPRATPARLWHPQRPLGRGWRTRLRA